jgi:hypothetical protein
MAHLGLEPRYSTSYALVIGINQYKYCSPLGYAVSDAEAITHILEEKFGFLSKNIYLLCDSKAKRTSILERYLSFTSSEIEVNDRVFIFFARHGHTVQSRRGDVGYLIPSDGNVEKLDSLIRWDEFTRNADLIRAKHMLFIMDACCGGLAVNRAPQAGSMRFLKDMLLRISRQVITAGKADEVVADLGGPLPNHSIFTGYLIEALSGKSAFRDGSITANGVMSYVYEKVGHDPNSHQTPHYGFIEGDGDFIFIAPILNSPLAENEKKGQDIMVSIPAFTEGVSKEEKMDLIQQTKELLSDPRYKIKLHDLVTQKTREILYLTSNNAFPVQGSWSNDEFLNRIKKYEEVSLEIQAIEILISYWGHDNYFDILTMPAKRLSNNLGYASGSVKFISLSWYPILLLTYSAGIAAVAKNRYDNLYELLHFEYKDINNRISPIILALFQGLHNVYDDFKLIPGHEQQYVPLSEYLFTLLQPTFDDLLFLGTDYESAFDQFEVLLALEYAHLHKKEVDRIWGPPGRFVWKLDSYGMSSPILQIEKQADMQGSSWLPIKAGFFNSSPEQFKEIMTGYKQKLSVWGYS